ncbi:MAG: CheR family methyltransferase [Cyanobacteria bacterium P01_F01_bin.86]
MMNAHYLHAIEDLLSKHIGLDPKTLGSTVITQVVSRVMKDVGISKIEAYWQHLQTSKIALEALVNAIVVPETSFFRNPKSFAYLRNYILLEWRKNPRSRPLRILSIPCSTGEEVYSIAMTLMEAGLGLEDFCIDAVDISPNALTKAQQGIYQNYVFRKTTPHFPTYLIHKYFQDIQGAYHIHDWVKSSIHFHRSNLANTTFLIKQTPYDIIFCRNLLIYFHPSGRESARRNLNRLLVDNGLLFIGYAETSQVDNSRFTPISYQGAFAYRKRPRQSPPITGSAIKPTINYARGTRSKSTSPQQPKIIPLKRIVSPQIHAKSIDTKLTNSVPAKDGQKAKITASGSHYKIPKASTPQAKPQVKPQAKPVASLSSIRDLANSGSLVLAAKQCARHLKHHPTSAAAYLLLGEIHQAQGNDDQADMAFQKAIYLSPTCTEAMIHRILLCEQKGDQVTAQRLRQRLKRLGGTDEFPQSDGD